MRRSKKGVLGAFPIVATAYAEKFNVPVYLGGNTAYTDGKKIVMPDALNDGFPMDVAWGYLAHEAAHIKWSDFKFVGDSPFEHGLINALEDCRIEKAMIDTYPGTFYTLEALDRYLIDCGKHAVPSVSSPGPLVQAVCLYWGMCNVVCKDCFDGLLADGLLALRSAIGESATHQIIELLHAQMKKANSTADIKKLAKDIIAVLKQTSGSHTSSDNDQRQQEPQGSEVGSSSGQSSLDDTTSPNDCDDGAIQNGNNNSDAGSGCDIGGSEAGLELLDCDSLDSLNDRASMIRESINEAVDASMTSSSETCYAGAEVIRAERNSGAFIASEADRLASRMQRELLGLVQSKARVASAAKRVGSRIDNRRVLRLLSGDTRVFRSARETINPSTAVHILVDTSGSMNGKRIEVVVPAAYAIAKALGSIKGVNPAVTAFANDGISSILKVVLAHGQKAISCKDRFGAMRARGSTPLAQAVTYACFQLSKTKENRKIIFCLTDGKPCKPRHAARAINLAQDSGIEVFGIGVLTDVVDRFFNQRIQINNLDELPEKLFQLVGKQILSSVAA